MVVVVVEGGKKKKEASWKCLDSGCLAKIQTTSPTVRGLNGVARGTIRDALGLALSCGEGDRGLGWTAGS